MALTRFKDEAAKGAGFARYSYDTYKLAPAVMYYVMIRTSLHWRSLMPVSGKSGRSPGTLTTDRSYEHRTHARTHARTQRFDHMHSCQAAGI